MYKPTSVAIFSLIIFILACITAPLIVFAIAKDYNNSTLPPQIRTATIDRISENHFWERWGFPSVYTIKVYDGSLNSNNQPQLQSYDITEKLYNDILNEFDIHPTNDQNQITAPKNLIQISVWPDDSIDTLAFITPQATTPFTNKDRDVSSFRLREGIGVFFALLCLWLIWHYGQSAWAAFGDVSDGPVILDGYIVHFDLLHVLHFRTRSLRPVAHLEFILPEDLEAWKNYETQRFIKPIKLLVHPEWLETMEQDCLTTVTLSPRLHYVYAMHHHPETVFIYDLTAQEVFSIEED